MVRKWVEMRQKGRNWPFPTKEFVPREMAASFSRPFYLAFKESASFNHPNRYKCTHVCAHSKLNNKGKVILLKNLKSTYLPT